MILNESREFKILVLRSLHIILYAVGAKTSYLREEMEKLTPEIMDFVKELKQASQRDYESLMK